MWGRLKSIGNWMKGWMGGGKCILAPPNDGRAGCFDERAAGRAFDFGVGRAPDRVVRAAGGGRVLAEELESVEEILRDSCQGEVVSDCLASNRVLWVGLF